MKNLYLCLVCSFFIQIAQAQKKCSIINTHAFATTIFPGTVQVDMNGNEVPAALNYSRKIYLTTTCNVAPIISSIFYNTVKAKYTIKAINEKSIEIGNDKNGKKTNVSCVKSNYLWEVNIDLGENNIATENMKTIILKGTYKKVVFKLNAKEINIIPLIMPV
jgi:hypothetical protein